MANLASIRQSGADLSLDAATPLTLDDVGQHFLQRAITESDLEELVRRFPAFFLSSDAQDVGNSLLIVGQQVRNQAGGRADIVAVDGTGALVLVELKRDAAASTQRHEPFE
jgi:RecB family endonuclease NucS